MTDTDVFEITFRCPQCGQETIEISTDLFDSFYQRGCGECGSNIMKVMRCKHIFGDPIPDPDEFFELKPGDTEE